MAVITCGRTEVFLLKKRDAVHALLILDKLVRLDFVSCHIFFIAVTLRAGHRHIGRIHSRARVACGTNTMTAVTACALRYLGVSFGETDSVNAGFVFCQLIDRHPRIVGAHICRVRVTPRACLCDVERIDGRRWVLYAHNAVRLVARCALNDVFFPRQRYFCMNALLQFVPLIGRQGGAVLLHFRLVGVALCADDGNSIAAGLRESPPPCSCSIPCRPSSSCRRDSLRTKFLS